jgi:hypothetical protein
MKDTDTNIPAAKFVQMTDVSLLCRLQIISPKGKPGIKTQEIRAKVNYKITDDGLLVRGVSSTKPSTYKTRVEKLLRNYHIPVANDEKQPAPVQEVLFPADH